MHDTNIIYYTRIVQRAGGYGGENVSNCVYNIKYKRADDLSAAKRAERWGGGDGGSYKTNGLENIGFAYTLYVYTCECSTYIIIYYIANASL